MNKLFKIFFALYVTLFTLSCAACGHKNENIGNNPAIKPNLTLTAQGMTCPSCKLAIEQGLKDIDGVKNALVLLEESMDNVLIEYDEKKTNKKALIAVIEDRGFTVINQD